MLLDFLIHKCQTLQGAESEEFNVTDVSVPSDFCQQQLHSQAHVLQQVLLGVHPTLWLVIHHTTVMTHVETNLLRQLQVQVHIHKITQISYDDRYYICIPSHSLSNVRATENTDRECNVASRTLSSKMDPKLNVPIAKAP